MMWLLIILSIAGDPKLEGPYERAQCELIMRRVNTQSTPGVWAHCAPVPT